jgi:hypothetical protein
MDGKSNSIRRKERMESYEKNVGGLINKIFKSPLQRAEIIDKLNNIKAHSKELTELVYKGADNSKSAIEKSNFKTVLVRSADFLLRTIIFLSHEDRYKIESRIKKQNNGKEKMEFAIIYAE